MSEPPNELAEMRRLRALLAAQPGRIDIRAFAESMTVEELRRSYVTLIDAVSRITAALAEVGHPIEAWQKGDGSIDAAIRLLKSRGSVAATPGNMTIDVKGSDDPDVVQAIRSHIDKYFDPSQDEP
jgi:hypothetical protein